jgi:hypothetical protein
MIQLDSDSTYGSTVFRESRVAWKRECDHCRKDRTRFIAFPQPLHVHRGQPGAKTARGCPALTGQVF